MYYDEFKTYFSSIYHNNIILADKKSFVLYDLFKLKIWKNLVTGTISERVIAFSTNTRKRYNIIKAIRLYPMQYSQKNLRSVIIDENGPCKFFQNCTQLLI